MNTASAMAAGAIAFKEADPKYAATLLQHAKDLYEFGESCPGDYIKVCPSVVVGRALLRVACSHFNISVDRHSTLTPIHHRKTHTRTQDGRIPAGNMYNDGGQYWDEHAFAAAWLYKATGDKKYLVRAFGL